MWTAGSTPGRESAHANCIIPGPLAEGVQTLYATFHWGPGEAMAGTGHGLVKITYDVAAALEWFARPHQFPEDLEDFDPYDPPANPVFTYEGPYLIAQDPGRAHGNCSPLWDPATGRFHLWYTTFVPKTLRPTQEDLETPRDRRVYYKYSDDPTPWTDLAKWSAPVEWSDREGLWARAPVLPFTDENGQAAWLLPHSDEATWLPEYENDWSVRFAVSRDRGASWELSGHYGIGIIPNPPFKSGKPRGGIIQPTAVQMADGSLYCLCRSHRGRIVELRSQPGGRLGLDWTTPRDTALPNNNSGIAMTRLTHGPGFAPVPGTDGGRGDPLVLIYNPNQASRFPVSIAGSRDGGATWRCLFDLRTEQGELSYPWILQTPDGLVHCTYSLHRLTIAHDVFRPDDIPGDW
jgi:hypothetical protein